MKKHKKLFEQKLDALTEQITAKLKLSYSKVSVQKAWFNRFFAWYEVWLYYDDLWHFTLYYYPEAKDDIEQFMITHRGARYNGYELILINSYQDFVDLKFDTSTPGVMI